MFIWMFRIFIILEIEDQLRPKTPRMIPKQAIRYKHIIASIFPSAPLFTTPLAHSFSKLSGQLQTGFYRHYICKSSNVRFRSNDFSLLTYFQHPSIVPKKSGTIELYEIKDSPVFTLNFLSDATEDMLEQAWQSRRTISLTFREAVKLMKLRPLSKSSFALKQTSQSDHSQSQTYTKWLTVTDCPEKAEIEMLLKQTSQNQLTKQEDNLWEVRFSIKYEDYPTFINSIRSNMLYISGAKFNIEVTKEESILELDFSQTTQQTDSGYKFGKPAKEATSVKKKPGRPKKSA